MKGNENEYKYKYLDTFTVVRRNGKQLERLVDLFKKVGKEKVHAAYLIAFNESIVISKSEPEIKGRPFEDYFYEECDKVIKLGDEENE